ncbi:MAG: leucyl aminopeptidase [Mobilicoccus sp.]|nr:leucyl aminopeptidase [Mobilicoccus sp.]
MKLAFATTAPESASSDVLVVFSQAESADAKSTVRVRTSEPLPAQALTHIEDALVSLRAKGKADEVLHLTSVPKVGASVVVVTGLGTTDTVPSPEKVRRAAGAAARTLTGRASATIALPVATPEHASAVAEGVVLGAYRFENHRGAAARREAEAPLDDVTLVAGKKALAGKTGATADQGKVDAADMTDAVAAGEVLGRHRTWARDLVNTAPNELYPQSFADTVRAAAGKGVKIEVLDEKELETGGFGGLMAVGRGSARGPRLVKMTYSPRKASANLAFVGKGITFDSGGLSLKPANSMMTMKCDMGGAAAVAGAVLAVAELGLPVAVTGYLCLAENMPSGDATRPGDVITQRGGRTVEVLNTDAEGRLVLADGIALAAESSPDVIVDVATLTGAAIIALGDRTAAVLANDEEVQGALTQAATLAGESVWPLPIAEEIREHISSDVADLKNMGKPGTAGTLAAAAFLREFATPAPTKGKKTDKRTQAWGHIDIAGPAFNDGGPYGYTVKGGTGFGVATLVEFARGYTNA